MSHTFAFSLPWNNMCGNAIWDVARNAEVIYFAASTMRDGHAKDSCRTNVYGRWWHSKVFRFKYRTQWRKQKFLLYVETGLVLLYFWWQNMKLCFFCVCMFVCKDDDDGECCIILLCNRPHSFLLSYAW